LITPCVAAGEKLTSYLKIDKKVQGELISVIPPKEINKFTIKVNEAAAKDPAWFEEFFKGIEDGTPLPFHEKLGLTKEDHDEYLKLWSERKIVPITETKAPLTLRKNGNKYKIEAPGLPIGLLTYDSEKDQFNSTLGALKSTEAINAPAVSVLGAWSGNAWTYEAIDDFTNTKETLSLGRSKDGKYGFLLYRLRRLSLTGELLMDQSLVVRFSPVVQAKK